MKQRFLLLTIIVAMISCNSPKNEAKRIVKKWIGKEIVLPAHDIAYKTMGRDTICIGIWEKPHKIFVYIDSIGCTSCRLGLSQWMEIIDSSRLVYPDLGFLFVVHSNNYRKFEYELRDAEFTYPIIYDYRNDFYKLNKFPPDPYRTFLLDRDNKILLIGSPVRNPKIRELYRNALARRP